MVTLSEFNPVSLHRVSRLVRHWCVQGVDMAVIYMEWHDLVEYVPFSLHGTPYLPVALMVWQMWVRERKVARV
eukprot:1774452-Amphidinium_carterae.2